MHIKNVRKTTKRNVNYVKQTSRRKNRKIIFCQLTIKQGRRDNKQQLKGQQKSQKTLYNIHTHK